MPTTPVNVIDNATAYLMAAEKLDVADLEDASFSRIAPAFYLLVGFAIELSLKAFILQATGDQRQIETLRHDLLQIETEAEAAGFVAVDWRLGNLVATMADHHRSHVFRYTPDASNLDVPAPELVIPGLRAHLEQMRQLILR
jgi:hypothetical protein